MANAALASGIALLLLLQSEPRFHMFTSKEHQFMMQYPRTWNRAETSYDMTVIRVENPEEGDDYNITVYQNPVFAEKTTEELTQYFAAHADKLVDISLRKIYPDAKLIDSGMTTLSQQPAAYYIADFTLQAAGLEIPMRVFAITTKWKDKQYTLTFRTPQGRFDEAFPLFQELALTFQLKKAPTPP